MSFQVPAIQFRNNNNIWDLTGDDIPPMYSRGTTHSFERRAIVQVNVEEQIHLSEIVFSLKTGT
jgi:hypothetical protein